MGTDFASRQLAATSLAVLGVCGQRRKANAPLCHSGAHVSGAELASSSGPCHAVGSRTLLDSLYWFS